MNVKYRVLGLLFVMQLVNYLDRVNLSVAAPTMMRELHLSPGKFGFILAAFTLGYAIAQIPGGALGDRFGAKRVLVGSALGWSFFTGLTGLVGTLAALILVRVLFGLAEGTSNGPAFKLVGDFFTSRERARANGLYLTSLAVGPALVAPIAAWMLTRVGWHGMFLLFVIPGVLLAALIATAMPNARHTPEPASRDEDTGSWGGVMARKTSWLLFFAYMAFNVAFWGYLGWMPSYLTLARHIDLKQLGLAASVPYLFGFLGMLLFGWLGSRALYRYRALLVAAGYAGAGIALFAAFRAATPIGSIAGLSAAAFFLYGGFGPVWGIALDLTPSTARGAFSGFINCGGQIGGFFAPIIVGLIVSRTGAFTDGFLTMIAALLLSAACFAVLHPSLRRVARAPVEA